jgi:hypothetical protein
MPETKIIYTPSTLKVDLGVGTLETKPPLTEVLQVRVLLNVENLDSAFYFETIGGELLIATDCLEDNIIFDVNSQGELIIISPPEFIWNLNEEGELILNIVSQGQTGIGIGEWVVEDNFSVS